MFPVQMMHTTHKHKVFKFPSFKNLIFGSLPVFSPKSVFCETVDALLLRISKDTVQFTERFAC